LSEGAGQTTEDRQGADKLSALRRPFSDVRYVL